MQNSENSVPLIFVRERRLITRLVVGAVLINLFVYVLVALSLWLIRENYQERTAINTRNLAQTLEADISGNIDRVNASLAAVVSLLEQQLAGGRLEEERVNDFIAALQRQTPNMPELRVTDANGLVRYGNGVAPDLHISAKDRDYFIRLREDSAAPVVIGKPVKSRITGKWVLAIARRYNRPDGRFAGVVLSPIPLEYFTQVFSSLDIGRHGAISLRDYDQAVVVRYPENEGIGSAVGHKTISPTLRELLHNHPGQGTYKAVVTIDLIERVISYRAIAKYPLYIFVGLAPTDFLAPWRREALLVIALTAVFTLVSSLSVWRWYRGWVTETKADEALQQSERNYRELVENLNVGVFRTILSSDRVISANNALLEIFGYETVAEFQQQPLSAHYLDETDLSLVIGQISRNGQVKDWEVAARKKDGSLFWVAVSAKARYDANGAVCWIDGIVEDITERRRTKETLRENEQRFRAIFEHSGIGIAVVDMEGHPKEFNPVLLEMLGYEAEELRSMTFAQFTHPDDCKLDWQLFGELVEGKRDRYQMEKRYLTKTGQGIWGRLTVSLIRNTAGTPLYCIGMVDDITQRKQMQEVMVQTEKMAMVAGLAAGMAHEINNPLGVIVQNLQVLERRLSPQYPRNREIATDAGIEFEGLIDYLKRQEVFDFISGIREAGRRASKVMENMLQFSRKSEGAHQPVHLPAVCDLALEMTENDYDLKKHYDFKHISIVREYADDVPQISVSVSEIEQVLINLFKNAAQALFESCASGKPQIRITVRRHGDMVEIKVADNGPGMTEEITRRIFEPFFTTKEVGIGTGLGLAVSYTIITKNHGGSITVESSPGAGACFSLLLPIARQSPLEA